jgi:hypothetical protein
MFDLRCQENGIEHRLTQDQASMDERPGRAHEPGDQGSDRPTLPLRSTRSARSSHLADFINAYNYARLLKTLKGLTPYEYICKCWTSQPERFKLNPLQQMPGLNT